MSRLSDFRARPADRVGDRPPRRTSKARHPRAEPKASDRSPRSIATYSGSACRSGKLPVLRHRPAPRDWPTDHAALVEACAAAAQLRPTPLLLRYGPGDFNRLHQDIYGELVFPLQVVVLLDEPCRDFTDGELVLVEGRARMQSRASVPRVRRGDAVIFPVRERPVAGARGWARASMRHGVAEVRSGMRSTLGVIFHDAR